MTESQLKEWLEKWVNTQQSKRLYTIKESAEYLGISPRTIYNMVSSKSFPIQPKRFGGKPLFEKSELDGLADSLPR